MKQRGPKQQPRPAASESHYEATAGFYQVNSQLYRITSLLILTGSMTTSGRELTLLLALYSPPLTAPLYWPQPLGAIRASRRSSTAVRCPPLLPLPSFSPFSLFFSFFPGCFQKQASATENHRAPAGLLTLSTPLARVWKKRGRTLSPLFSVASLFRPTCIYLAHLCFCIINRWKL